MGRLLKFPRNLWSPGIRIQLTLWYLLVFTGLILLFGSVFYLRLSKSLETSFDDALQQRTQGIASGINEEQGTITVQDTTGTLPSSADDDQDDKSTGLSNAVHKTIQEQFSNVDLGTLVRVVGAKGQIIYVSPAFLALHVPSASIAQPLKGTAWWGTISTHNGQMVRMYSAPLSSHGTIYGVVQVGQSLTSLSGTLRSIVLELLVIGPFVLLLSALGSYWLAGRAFAPIHRLTQTARHIEASDLHRRVPVPHTKDEVQGLALTFNEMIQRLDEAFTRQRRFVADASHELRTPVAAIRSMTDVMLARQTPITPAEYETVLRDVNAEAERLGSLISDMLALARADEGQMQLEREAVRLDTLAADVVATIEPLASERDIALEVQAPAAVTVPGDEARLIQVIMNLIDNAITYTNPGGKITVSVESKQGKACLIVRDTGIGIAEKHLEHIFERFYRADPARSRNAGGTGLGLSIVEWVIQALGGTISVTSQLGEGTAFTVLLPLAN